MKKLFNVVSFVLGIWVAFFTSCSSAPKRAMLVTEVSDTAAAIYENANNELIRGHYHNAGGHLQNAYNLALTVDDADLLCRISLSAIIYKITYNPLKNSSSTYIAKVQKEPASDIPFYGISASDLLVLAKSYAQRSESPKILGAVCEVYEARIKLALNEKLNSEQICDKLLSSEKILSKEHFYRAFLYRTCGDVYAAGGMYSQARDLYLKASQIHLKHRYLSEIGLDYYCAARMSSQSGDKERALEEIDIALKYDKDAENTVAIAADYYAYGLILLKGNPGPADKIRAKNSILWAAQIYRAGGFADEAEECSKAVDNIQ